MKPVNLKQSCQFRKKRWKRLDLTEFIVNLINDFSECCNMAIKTNRHSCIEFQLIRSGRSFFHRVLFNQPINYRETFSNKKREFVNLRFSKNGILGKRFLFGNLPGMWIELRSRNKRTFIVKLQSFQCFFFSLHKASIKLSFLLQILYHFNNTN